MKVTFRLFGIMSLLLILGLSSQAQEQTNAPAAVDQLRLQLIEVHEKEESLRIRAQQLDEDLKPENIERAFAGIGSTRPEELREARRRQLTIQRESVKAQLKLVELTRVRLESALTTADGRAYEESALPLPSPAVNALRAGSLALKPALIAILILSFVVSIGTMIITMKGESR